MSQDMFNGGGYICNDSLIDSSVCISYDFFYNYEEPELGGFLFRVLVYGELGDFDSLHQSRRGDRPNVKEIKDSEDLLRVLGYYINLWSKPYIIIEKHPRHFFVKDKGVRFRSYIYRKRFFTLIDTIPKSWFKVKGKKSRHIVITITVPRSIPLGESFSYIRRRLRSILNYFRKRYGLKGYLGVWEIHKDGYPHIHIIVFTKRRLKVFRHKGIYRFKDKRLWDKDLRTSERGFIDCFALRGGKRGAKGYFSKYLSKSFFDSSVSGSSNTKEINFKPYSLFIFRLFRVRPIIASKSIRDLAKPYQPTRLTVEDLKDLNREEYKLYLLGKFIYEFRPRNLEERARFERELEERINDLIIISPSCFMDNTISREKLIAAAVEVFEKWEKTFVVFGYCLVSVVS